MAAMIDMAATSTILQAIPKTAVLHDQIIAPESKFVAYEAKLKMGEITLQPEYLFIRSHLNI